MKTPTHYLVIDFEATCSKDNAEFPRSEMEIIEFGAVLCEAQGLSIVGEFQSFVRPVRRPVLTEFCRQLTGITQAEVNGAPPFPRVIAALKEKFPPSESVRFCSWGDYDKNQLRQDCTFHRVPYPFLGGHSNLKRLFMEAQELEREMGVGQALRTAGLAFEGRQHRAIDDARNIARLLPYIF